MFHGIVVYKDKSNGCLNGTWTNTGCIGSLMNESLRKVDNTIDTDCICGEYHMAYIESDGTIITGKVTVSKNKSTYIFDWYNSTDKHIFTGIGLKSGKKHYTVSFIKIADKDK